MDTCFHTTQHTCVSTQLTYNFYFFIYTYCILYTHECVLVTLAAEVCKYVFIRVCIHTQYTYVVHCHAIIHILYCVYTHIQYAHISTQLTCISTQYKYLSTQHTYDLYFVCTHIQYTYISTLWIYVSTQHNKHVFPHNIHILYFVYTHIQYTHIVYCIHTCVCWLHSLLRCASVCLFMYVYTHNIHILYIAT